MHYPDLDPPAGWPGFRAGSQVRLIPPFGRPEEARVAIIISPLLGRSRQLPPPRELIEETIRAESAMTGLEIEQLNGPMPIRADSGISGVAIEVSTRNPTQRRVYVLLADETCYYGVSFLAAPELAEQYEPVFWSVVKSIRPFAGTLDEPGGDPFGHWSD